MRVNGTFILHYFLLLGILLRIELTVERPAMLVMAKDLFGYASPVNGIIKYVYSFTEKKTLYVGKVLSCNNAYAVKFMPNCKVI